MFNALWFLAICAKPLTAAVLAMRRLVLSWPVLCTYLFVSAVKSYMLFVAAMGGSHQAIWAQTQWLDVALYAGLALELFKRVMDHIPDRRLFTWALGLTLALLSGSVATIVHHWAGVSPARIPADVKLWLWVGNLWQLWCILFVLGIRAYCWLARGYMTLHSNVRAHSDILVFLWGTELICSALSSALAGSVRNPWQLATPIVLCQAGLLFAPIAACGAWVVMMKSSGETDGRVAE